MTPEQIKTILAGIIKKQYIDLWDEIPKILEEFEQDYGKYASQNEEIDDEDAFEWIYDLYLERHPENDDDDLRIASLLDAFFLTMETDQ